MDTLELCITDQLLHRLIITRMLIQAGSGGGKSWGIRYFAERFSGECQQFIFDWEGEFKTLREKFDFALVGNMEEGADIQLVVEYADTYAEKLYLSGMSIIFDLSNLGHKDRMRFVDRFLRKLMSFPLEWYQHAPLIYLDEAHKYCPQMRVIGDAADAVIDCATLGRKRDIGIVLATQRVSKLHKDASAECMNKMIGRTGQDVDQVRALDELGEKAITKKDLRQLKPGEFYCFGPALQEEVVKIKIGAVFSHHGKPPAGWKIPVPAAIQEVVAALADLPKEAAQEVHNIEALKKIVVQLKQKKNHLELRIKEFERLKLKPMNARKVLEDMQTAARNAAKKELQEQMDKADRLIETSHNELKNLTKLRADLEDARKRYQRSETLISRLGQLINNFSNKPVGRELFRGPTLYPENWVDKTTRLEFPIMAIPDFPKDAIGAASDNGEMVVSIPHPKRVITDMADNKVKVVETLHTDPPGVTMITNAPPVRWNKCEKTILDMLFGRDHWFYLYQISYYTGYSITSGGFDQAIRHLIKGELITKVEDGFRFVDDARDQVQQIIGHPPIKGWQLTVDFYRPNMPKCTAAILDLLNTHPHLALTRQQIADRTGYRVTSGGFDQSIRELVKLTLVYRNDDGTYIIHPDLR